MDPISGDPMQLARPESFSRKRLGTERSDSFQKYFFYNVRNSSNRYKLVVDLEKKIIQYIFIHTKFCSVGWK